MVNYTLTFREKKSVADGTDMFIFDKPADFSFEAGQYVVLRLSNLVAPDEREGVRSFSFSSAPCEEQITFTTRQGISGFKQTMYALQPGETITATGPVGHFTLSHAPDDRPIVFLVGGIGVTPMRSILKQAEHDGSTRSFTALYSNRYEKDAAFHEELQNLRVQNFRYIPTFSQETLPCSGVDEERGYICERMIRKYVSDVTAVWFYLVGAPGFIEAMEEILSHMGVAKERQVCDPFAGMIQNKKRYENVKSLTP